MGFSIQQQKDGHKLDVDGSDMKEAFMQGAKGIFSLEHDIDRVADTERIKIALSSTDLSSLFTDWLTELIERKKIDNLIFSDFRVASLQKVNEHQYVLTGEAFGEPYDQSRHQRKGEIQQIAKGVCENGSNRARCSCLITMK